ncbi:FecR family protein [Shinella sp.]|uniref:FecR family protein n=1 Tax=Shinella sp. TaxID=1870904 RepID=UPI003F6F47E6
MEEQDNRDRIEAEAAEWVIRLADASLDERGVADFDLWHAQSPRHASAFAFARKTWGELAGIRSNPGPLAADLAQLRKRGEMPAGIVAMKPQRVWRRAGLSAICLAVAFGFASFWYGNPITLLTADYRTAPGEQRTVLLPDGTIVDLSSASAIALDFNEGERRVTLIEGAAYFTASPMHATERRPFVVEGANGTATALGTQFAVDRLPDAVEVSVAEHDVRVELSGTEASLAAVVLSPGQSIRYSLTSGLGHVSQKNVERGTAWRRGRLIFDQVPLSEVVAELNRYRRGRIVISSSALANRKVSGVFQTDNLDTALRTITRELGARTASLPPFVSVLY